MIAWFDRISLNLVLLEERPLADVRTGILAFEAAVREHVATAESRFTTGLLPKDLTDLRTLLRADHVWFDVSLEQLEWFYAIVERDDHGGHRQALGQYGRVVTEALRRHRRDEATFLGATVATPRDGPE